MSEADEQKVNLPSNKRFGTILISMNPEVQQNVNNAVESESIEVLEKRPIPSELDGRVLWKKYLSPIYNQGNSNACYAYATISVLADKFAIQTLLQVKPFFDPLVEVFCGYDIDTLTNYQQMKNHPEHVKEGQKRHLSELEKGDTIYSVGRYLYRWGATEESCVPAKTFQEPFDKKQPIPFCTDLQGPDENLCIDHPGARRVAQRVWPISTFFILPGKGDELIKNMKLNIMKWGPLIAAFNIFPDFLNEYDGKSIYIPKPGQHSLGGHAVKIVGWGETNGVLYWICANSWGTNWGDKGYFKIVQGNKELELEDNHMDIAPQIPGLNIPYLPIISLISQIDKENKAFNAVDPLTFYPKDSYELIKQGKIKGKLEPLIDIAKVPLRQDFFAYELDKTTFSTFGGGYVGAEESANSTKSTTNLWSILIILGILTLITGLGFLLWKCVRSIRLN